MSFLFLLCLCKNFYVVVSECVHIGRKSSESERESKWMTKGSLLFSMHLKVLKWMLRLIMSRLLLHFHLNKMPDNDNDIYLLYRLLLVLLYIHSHSDWRYLFDQTTEVSNETSIEPQRSQSLLLAIHVKPMPNNRPNLLDVKFNGSFIRFWILLT